jgi:AcrR family transcriptional regulator
MADRTDPRITRTEQAFEQAIVELAARRPVSQITVADLADRAGVTRATFYNRYVANEFAGAIKAWLSDG